MLITPQMQLTVWNSVNDNFQYTQLLNTFLAIDSHDHSQNKGVQINTPGIANGAITAAKIANQTITANQIANGAVGTNQIATGAVTGAKVASHSLGLSQLAAGAWLLTPTQQGSVTYNANNGDLVQATSPFTQINLPSPTNGNVVGIVNSGTGRATIIASTGYIVGPGVTSNTNAIYQGAYQAFLILAADGTNWNVVAGQVDSGWVNNPFPTAPFTGSINYRTIGSIVYVEGSITCNGASSGGAQIMTMPPGYIPTIANCYFAVTNNINPPQLVTLAANTNGTLVAYIAGGATGFAFFISYPSD